MHIHKEGYSTIAFVVITLAVLITALALFVPKFWILFGVSLIGVLTIYQTCSFFRIPERSILLDDNGVVAPADGKIVMVEEVFVPEFLNEPRLQVSIFMNLFNVHVNWYPIGGIIVYYKYHPGDKMVAWHPKSSEKNEHTTVFLKRGKTIVGVRQIAGLVARRVVCSARQTKLVQQCSELGIIKFGSRVDILLPLGTTIKVKVGDKVRGSETLIAKLKE